MAGVLVCVFRSGCRPSVSGAEVERRGCEGEGAPSVGSSGYGGSREGSPEEGGLITVDMKEEEKRLRERESREQSLGEEVCVYVCVYII